MIISLIAAVDKNQLIGCNNQLPWHLPADLKNFRRLTMGKPILMGRCTHESIGRVLPGRDNIVITRNPHYQASGCTVVHTLESGLEVAKEAEEMMIIGGASLYRQTLPKAQRIYLTQVYESFNGDAWFPDLDPYDAWIEVWQEYHSPDANNLYPYSFSRLERSLNLNKS
ncbi:dihydrofolate reductase [Candidatus Nitrosoglobus terrae]|uniref:Dihydrofolate reductase n=1 Tax=Candidatus Nitrosoglobus terrae TaxID=1630141 RepID=A0A1Q2SPV5_9GAMM|nr:type 3 dihydrofolate reductase [Candidatus Nitrosoglobus terrae]BAW81151.1 dihydrofolate reductase [Candidatus Nitrosoglobus terrae]